MSEKIFIGFVDGMLSIGKESGDMITEIMGFGFDSDIETGQLKMALQNPLPFNFRKKGTAEVFRMALHKTKFTYILDVDDVDGADEIISYYLGQLAQEQLAMSESAKMKSEVK